jgi:hypothetical protein
MIERRVFQRHKSFMQGRVYFNHRRASVDCIMRDYSENGARLEIPHTFTVPDAIELFIPSKDEWQQAHVAWRKDQYIGVTFTHPVAGHHVPETNRTGDPLLDRVAKLEHDVAVLRKRLDSVQG